MTRRPALTFAGGDVALRLRAADGRAVVDFIDLAGQPIGHSARCHPHQLRGVGWHIAEIKRAIAALPLEGAPAVTPTPPTEPLATRPRGFLHAHFAVAPGDE